MAEAVIRVLKREKFLDRAILVGFDWPALIAAKKIEPKVRMLVHDVAAELVRRSAAAARTRAAAEGRT